MVLGLSMARLDLWSMAKAIAKPRAFSRAVGLTLLLMPVTVCIYAGLAKLVGLSTADQISLLLLAAAPPIASSAGLCFLLGFNARLALEATLMATLLTPILGPLIVSVLLPDMAPISPFLLAQKLGAMILGGLIFGLALRRIIGADRIDQNKLAFDGIAALGMVLFVIPLFDGVGATILGSPTRALWVIALVVLFNLGTNLITTAIARLRTTEQDAGALGLLWGNRTIAIYLAALPYDPQFSLFVALYQFPMYLTPLLWQHIKR